MANYPYNTNWNNPNGGPNPYPAPAPAPIPASQPPVMPNPQNQQNRPNYICYPVGSVEEAIASRVEAFDPPHIMLDFSHNLVYYKRFNQQTGGSEFAAFKRIPNEEVMPKPTQAPDYDTEIKALNDRVSGITEKLDSLLDILNNAKAPRSSASKGAAKE